MQIFGQDKGNLEKNQLKSMNFLVKIFEQLLELFNKILK